jgi:hypothetical protein
MDSLYCFVVRYDVSFVSRMCKSASLTDKIIQIYAFPSYPRWAVQFVSLTSTTIFNINFQIIAPSPVANEADGLRAA